MLSGRAREGWACRFCLESMSSISPKLSRSAWTATTASTYDFPFIVMIWSPALSPCLSATIPGVTSASTRRSCAEPASSLSMRMPSPPLPFLSPRCMTTRVMPSGSGSLARSGRCVAFPEPGPALKGIRRAAEALLFTGAGDRLPSSPCRPGNVCAGDGEREPAPSLEVGACSRSAILPRAVTLRALSVPAPLHILPSGIGLRGAVGLTKGEI
mmetsp:Transcript_11182/g.26169  ORF Transcript_11182/g.26169 Transcript_11182/m.26169 type:complete len:213 (-) Transcript_11182:7-645(-)